MAENDFMQGLQEVLQKETGQGFQDDVLPTQNLAPSSPTPGVDASAQPERALTDPPVRGKTRQHFKALEQSKRNLEQTAQQQQQAWEQERTALKTELETLKKGRGPEHEQELQRLREEIAALDITRDPQFAARFEKPREIAIGQAANLSGARAADVKAVLAMEPGTLRDQRLQEILGELPASVAAVVKAANDKVLGLSFERQVELETARSTWQQRAEAKAQQQRLEQARREQALPTLVEQWKGSVDMLNPDKYPGATKVVADASRFFKGDGLSDSEKAAVALQSAMFVPLSVEYENALQEVESLKARLAKYERSFPSGDGRGEGSQQHDPRNADERIERFNRGLDRVVWEDPTFGGARR